jgi:hypothetical protein
MKKAIFTLALFAALLSGVTGFSSGKVINSLSTQCQFTEWVEYVYIGEQLYKITHHEDGSETIQAVFVYD